VQTWALRGPNSKTSRLWRRVEDQTSGHKSYGGSSDSHTTGQTFGDMSWGRRIRRCRRRGRWGSPSCGERSRRQGWSQSRLAAAASAPGCSAQSRDWSATQPIAGQKTAVKFILNNIFNIHTWNKTAAKLFQIKVENLFFFLKHVEDYI
jgi:hypothetical protein